MHLGLDMALLSNEKKPQARANRIHEYLPYFEFEKDEDSQFWRTHLLDDGSLAVAWKTRVPPSYSSDNGYLQTNNEFRTFIEGLPVGYDVQTIITSHNNLGERMRKYLSLDSGNDKGRLLRESRAEKLLTAGFNGYPVAEGQYAMLRDTYMIITLKAPPPGDELGFLKTIMNLIYTTVGTVMATFGVDPAKFKFFDDFFNSQVRIALSDFKEAVLSIESTLDVMFGVTRESRMSLTELKQHYWTAFAPSYKEAGQQVTLDEKLSFNEQCFPLPIEHEFDLVKVGRDYHGIVTLAMMPDTVAPDYFGIIRRTIATQYTFFCNINQPQQIMEQTKMAVSAELRRRISGSFNKEEADAFAQEVSEVKQRMFAGRKILFMTMGMIIHGYSRKEVEDKMLKVSSALKKLSAVPDMERSMALQGISYSWPLVPKFEFTRPFSRNRRVMSDDLVDLLPNHGHWGGSESPQAVYVNRDGEVTFFDHTSNDFVNWHYAITGTSGSGKSFAVVDLVLQLFAAGVERQFLMTIKDDYDRFAQTMGRLILIDLDSADSCINPFAGMLTKQRLQQWVEALELMIKKGGTEELDPAMPRLFEQVLQYAYDLVPDGDVLRPTWIKEAMQKFPYINEHQRSLGFFAADELGSYCSDGVYGKLFDGPPSISEKDRLVVFNLQNVLSEKISDVIINAIFTMLDNVMYMGDRAAKKHLLVDEMISMISSKGGAQVSNQLKRAFRTYRSLNCMCGIASQNEEDLTTDVGQAIIGNITKRMILKPRKEMIPMLMQSLGLRSERHEANIASLDTKPGFYSEFYLMSPAGEVVCRLLTDKLTFALASTQPDDVAEISRMRDEMGGDWWKATVAFSQKYPQGVRAARAAAAAEEERSRRTK